MKLEVISLDKQKKKLEVELSGLKGDKTYKYKFDTDKVDFKELWKLVREDLKTKKVITKHLKEISKKSKLDKTELPDPNAVDLELTNPGGLSDVAVPKR